MTCSASFTITLQINKHLHLFRIKLRFHLFFSILQEFDMIGLFGTPAGRSLSNHSSISSTQTKVKPKPAANLLDPSNQSNISNSNASVHGQNHQNLFKKRPNFLRFFNGNFLKSSADDTASEHSCKRFDIELKCLLT